MAEKKTNMDSKKMLSDNAKKGRKIRFNDRVEIEITEDTKHLKKGQVKRPHRVVAEQLIKEGIAKEVK